MTKLQDLAFNWDKVNFGGGPDRRFAHEGIIAPAAPQAPAGPAPQQPSGGQPSGGAPAFDAQKIAAAVPSMSAAQVKDLASKLSPDQQAAVQKLLTPAQVQAVQAKLAQKLMNLSFSWGAPDRRYAHSGVTAPAGLGGDPSASPGGAYMTAAQFANLKNLSAPQIASALQIATPEQLANLSTTLPPEKIDAVLSWLTPQQKAQVMAKLPQHVLLI